MIARVARERSGFVQVISSDIPLPHSGLPHRGRDEPVRPREVESVLLRCVEEGIGDFQCVRIPSGESKRVGVDALKPGLDEWFAQDR